MKDRLVGLADVANGLRRKSAPAQAQAIDAGEFGAMTARIREGNDIGRDADCAADHRMCANAGELLHGAQAAEKDVVADFRKAAERNAIRHEDMIAHDAIMPDMRAHHEITMIADLGDTAPFTGADI